MKKILILLTGSEAADNVIFKSIPALLKMKCCFDFIYIREKPLDVEYFAPKILAQGINDSSLCNEFKQQYDNKIQEYIKAHKCTAKLFFEECHCGAQTFVDYLNYYDLAIITKNPLNYFVKEILKLHTRPLILLDEIPLEKFHSISVAFDDSVQVCKSIFLFVALFQNTIHSVSLNSYGKITDNQKIHEYIRSKHLLVNATTTEKEPYSSVEGVLDIMAQNNFSGIGSLRYSQFQYIRSNEVHIDEKHENSEDHLINSLEKGNICIMGMLSHSAFFEQLLGNMGIQLLKKIKKPIFIG